MIKRILSIFIVGILSVGLAACGGEKEKQPNKTENTKQEVSKNSNVKDKHLDVLEDNKTYEEMSAGERTAAVEITKDYWNELSNEQKEKYKERKDFIEKTKAEAVEKWKKEEETKNANKVTKEDLKLKVENSIPQNAKGKSYTVDILTPAHGEGYIVSIQVDNKDFANKETCKNFTKDLLSKLKGTNGIHSLEITFVSNMKAANFLRIEEGNKIKDGSINNIDIQKF